MDKTSVEVLKSFPRDKTLSTLQQVLERTTLENKVYLQFFLCKLHAWGYVDEQKDTYSISDKGLLFLSQTVSAAA